MAWVILPMTQAFPSATQSHVNRAALNQLTLTASVPSAIPVSCGVDVCCTPALNSSNVLSIYIYNSSACLRAFALLCSSTDGTTVHLLYASRYFLRYTCTAAVACPPHQYSHARIPCCPPVQSCLLHTPPVQLWAVMLFTRGPVYERTSTATLA